MSRKDLSIIIPARNEIFLKRTIDDIFENAEADTEVIVVLDGYWPDPPLMDRPKVTIVHFPESIGQRAATNAGVRLSTAKVIAKVDAHCAFGKGFDRIILETIRYRWTVIPMMYNLHAFDWMCMACGDRTYQGNTPEKCRKCGKNEGFEMVEVWKPREGKGATVSWRFDNNMQFQYWRTDRKRAHEQGELNETLSFIGACFFMHRRRFWDLGGLDEAHGSWGQFGTEISCKSWLSGGSVITNKKTWFAHLFRTGNFRGSGHGGSTWPYPITQKQIDFARSYSKDYWINDKWPKAKKPLSWLLDKFKPIPDWHENVRS